MKSKRISEFVLSFCLSLSSLFAVAVPKVHAAAYTEVSSIAALERIVPVIVTLFIGMAACIHVRHKIQT